LSTKSTTKLDILSIFSSHQETQGVGWGMGLQILKNRFKNLLMREKQKQPPIVKMTITGTINEVLDDVRIIRPHKADSHAQISIRIKAVEGSWMEWYDIPLIHGENTTVPKRNVEQIYNQGRIDKEQLQMLMDAIDQFSRITRDDKEASYGKRYPGTHE